MPMTHGGKSARSFVHQVVQQEGYHDLTGFLAAILLHMLLACPYRSQLVHDSSRTFLLSSLAQGISSSTPMPVGMGVEHD